MQRRILQIFIHLSVRRASPNTQSTNTIPRNIKELRKRPQGCRKIHSYLRQFDPSYTDTDTTKWDTFNNGIIKIPPKTYHTKKQANKETEDKTVETSNIPARYRGLQTDINYYIFKINKTIE